MSDKIFDEKLLAECSADEHGCGLHALIDKLCNAAQAGDLSQDEANENGGLSLVLEQFKARYAPAANDFDLGSLWKLINELRDPVHRAFVFGRVFRNCLTDPDQRVPGTFVSDDQIQILGNKLGIRVESYATLQARARTLYPAESRAGEPLESLYARMAKKEIEDFRGASKPATEDEILAKITAMKARAPSNNLAKTDQDVPDEAPILALVNEGGGHWRRWCNDKDNEEENIADCKRHHEMYYGKTEIRRHFLFDPAHRAAAMDEIRTCLQNRRERDARSVAACLSDYERSAARYEHYKRLHPTATSSSAGTSSAGTSSSSSSTTASSEGSTTSSTMPNFNNPLEALGKQFPVLSSIFGAMFGWLAPIFGFVTSLMQPFNQNDPKNNPEYASRPLELGEIKSKEDELFAKYVNALPASADMTKKRLCQAWRSNIKPKSEILNELKDTLLEEGMISEYRDFVFNFFTHKLPSNIRSELRREYNLFGRSLEAWDSLYDELSDRGFDAEAREVTDICRNLNDHSEESESSRTARSSFADGFADRKDSAERERKTFRESAERERKVFHDSAEHERKTSHERDGAASEFLSSLRERLEKLRAEHARASAGAHSSGTSVGRPGPEHRRSESGSSDASSEAAIPIFGPGYDAYARASRPNPSRWFAPNPLDELAATGSRRRRPVPLGGPTESFDAFA